MPDVRNPFTAAWAAERYAGSRPNVHMQVMQHAQRTLPGPLDFHLGVDVGCGTGLSSRALTTLAPRVVAVDVSPDMLAHAQKHPSVTYIRARGEALPFATNTFDVATFACAFHWCDRTALLDEAHRVLRVHGWLIVYDNGFLGPTDAFPEYVRWHKDVYRAQYPPPPRRTHFHPAMAPDSGFRIVASEYLQQNVPLSAPELAQYLSTQSNVIAAVEAGEHTLNDVDRQLHDDLTSVFRNSGARAGQETRDFTFGGYVTYLRAVRR